MNFENLDPIRREARHLLARWRVLYQEAGRCTTCQEEARERAYRILQRELRDWEPELRERLLKLVREMEQSRTTPV